MTWGDKVLAGHLETGRAMRVRPALRTGGPRKSLPADRAGGSSACGEMDLWNGFSAEPGTGGG